MSIISLAYSATIHEDFCTRRLPYSRGKKTWVIVIVDAASNHACSHVLFYNCSFKACVYYKE